MTGEEYLMREIVLDTETTGLDPVAGHRVVELGCVELMNMVATGKTFHVYFNPEMIMPAGAQDIHGLSDEFLADKPLFADQADAFLEFIGDAQLVIHNATFDIGFLNAELARVGKPKLANPYVDTVSMARRKFPGQRASLDALCERFGIDNSSRTKHGALLDSELLAEVYLELSGGRQRDLGLAPEVAARARATGVAAANVRPARPHAASAAELAAHVEFLKKLSDALWLKTEPVPQA
jgi:DNA polymerase-3 subunit epsilon